MLYTSVDFEELVCYSQMGILILLGIGFIVRLKNKSKVGSTKVEDKCPTCNGVLYDKDKNYCANCGSLSSHSEGISLDSQNITNITNINISDSVISKSKVGNKETGSDSNDES